MKDTELLTVAEAAERCRVSENTMRQYIKDGLVRTVRLPGKGKGYRMTRITLSELQRIWGQLQSNGGVNKPKTYQGSPKGTPECGQ